MRLIKTREILCCLLPFIFLRLIFRGEDRPQDLRHLFGLTPYYGYPPMIQDHPS